MAAGRSQHEAVYAGWIERLDKINHQLVWSSVHRRIFTTVRDALIEKDRNRGRPHNGLFIFSYADGYWDSQVMVVRRLSDRHRDHPHSLPTLIDRLRKNPHVATRDRYVGLAGDDEGLTMNRVDGRYEPAEDRFTRLYGSGDVLEPTVLDRWEFEIGTASSVVAEHATTYIAHRDVNVDLSAVPVTFGVIHAALDGRSSRR